MKTDLLDPLTVARLASLTVRARHQAQGALAGLHRSRRHGSSIEFTEHKEYSPGDELRHIDWKAYGKLDKFYVKRFEEETELRCYLVLDASGSMGYAGGGAAGATPASKLRYGAKLAAALSYLLLRQQDPVGLLIARRDEDASLQRANARARNARWGEARPAPPVEGGRERPPLMAGLTYVPPRAREGHLASLLERLAAIEPGGETALAPVLRHLSEIARPRSLVVLLSDLFDPALDEVIGLLRGLRARRHEVAVFHLLDHDELTFPFRDLLRFRSMEGETREILCDSRATRRTYLAELEAFIAAARAGCAAGDVEYHCVDTTTPVDRALIDFLVAQVQPAAAGRAARAAAAGGREGRR